MSRRRQIELTADERDAFLDASKTVVLGTLGPKGWPHLVPMWFDRIDGLVHMTTYRRSQKAVNLRRDDRATLLVESGVDYAELRGIMIRGRGEIVDDEETCLDVFAGIQRRYGAAVHPDMRELLREQARKRVVIRIHPERVSSWDHRKLGGAY